MKKIISELFSFGRTLRDDNINAFAAHSAYFFILSFIPLIMLLLSLLQYTNVSKEYLVDSMNMIVPGEMHEFISEIVDEIYDKSIASVSVTAILTLWTSGKGMAALNNGMQAAVKPEKRKSFLSFRLTGSVNTLFFVLIIAAALALGVFGEKLEAMLNNKFEFSGSVMWFLMQFRKIIMFVAFIAVFTVFYKLIPAWSDGTAIKGKKPKLTELIPGAAAGALGWHVFSYAFSVYMKFSKGFENMYGSLAAIIGIMLWLYGCMYMLLAGLEVVVFYIQIKERYAEHKLRKNKNIQTKSA